MEDRRIPRLGKVEKEKNKRKMPISYNIKKKGKKKTNYIFFKIDTFFIVTCKY